MAITSKGIKVSEKITKVNSKSISLIIKDATKYKPLTINEEIALIKRIKKGDSKAIEELIGKNIRFAISISKQFEGYVSSLEDLIETALIGLWEAISKFDETKGFKFITYAVWWMRQAITLEIASNFTKMRLPVHIFNQIKDLKNLISILQQKLNREPTLGELFSEYYKKGKVLKESLNFIKSPISLEKEIGPNSKETYEDIVSSNQYNEKKFYQELNLDKKVLKKIITNLHYFPDTMEQKVIMLYLDIDNKGSKTIDEIACILKTSKTHVKKKLECGLKKLKDVLLSYINY